MDEGVGGFFKGVGKGVVGLVARVVLQPVGPFGEGLARRVWVSCVISGT